MMDLDLMFGVLKRSMGSEDPEDKKRVDEILAALEANDSPEVQQRLRAFLNGGLNKVKEDVEILRNQIAGDYEILPLAYIAKNYFNKSRNWLYQRLNGYKVRGKVYTLSDSEKEIFNTAVKDLAQRIGAIHLS